jgi:hypothetical protein
MNWQNLVALAVFVAQDIGCCDGSIAISLSFRIVAATRQVNRINASGLLRACDSLFPVAERSVHLMTSILHNLQIIALCCRLEWPRRKGSILYLCFLSR